MASPIKKIFLLCFILFLAFSFHLSAKCINRVVAVVNGQVITLYDLNRKLDNERLISNKASQLSLEEDQELKREILKSMINEILLEQEADRLQIKVSDVEVENRIKQLQERQGLSDQKFRKIIANYDMSFDEYREKIRDEIKKNRLIQSMVKQKVLVTDEDIREYYQNQRGKFHQSKKVNLSLIFMKDKNKLQSVQRKIEQGDLSFKQAARKFSQGPGSEQGGELGLMSWKDLNHKWKKELKTLQPGQMTEIFSIQNGYGILLFDSVQKEKQLSVKNVSKEIREKIYSQKLQKRFHDYIQQLRSKAVVEVRL